MQAIAQWRRMAAGPTTGLWVVGLAALVLFTGCQKQPAANCGALRVDNAVVEADPHRPDEMIAYFTLHNPGSHDVVLGTVTSTQFDHGELQMQVGGLNGRPVMKQVQSVDIKAGQSTVFAPGQRRVKLFAPTQHYGPGDQVELVLVCGKQAAELPVAATVRLPQASLPTPSRNDAGDDSRAQVLQDGTTGGGAGASDDSRTAGSTGDGQ